jgi:transposase
MKAYSLDLRQRVIELVRRGHRYPEVADLLGISLSTVNRYLRRDRQGDSLEPRPKPGRPPVKGTALDAGIAAQLRAQPDATLAEHCASWQAATGTGVSPSTMRRAIGRTGWSVKKNT